MTAHYASTAENIARTAAQNPRSPHRRAELSQEIEVVGLHPFLGESTVIGVAEDVVQFPVVVKLMFTIDNVWGRHVWGERMWVQVVAIKKRHIVGRLLNEPLAIPRLGHGDRIEFKRDHIIDIDWNSELLSEPSEEEGPPRTQTVRSAWGCNGHGNELETEVTLAGEPETEGPEAT